MLRIHPFSALLTSIAVHLLFITVRELATRAITAHFASTQTARRCDATPIYRKSVEFENVEWLPLRVFERPRSLGLRTRGSRRCPGRPPRKRWSASCVRFPLQRCKRCGFCRYCLRRTRLHREQSVRCDANKERAKRVKGRDTVSSIQNLKVMTIFRAAALAARSKLTRYPSHLGCCAPLARR